jgi:hypothetical protein
VRLDAEPRAIAPPHPSRQQRLHSRVSEIGRGRSIHPLSEAMESGGLSINPEHSKADIHPLVKALVQLQQCKALAAIF